jgi:transposase
MINLPSGTRIWLVAGITDIRKPFHVLSEQVQHVLNKNPYSGNIFILQGRKGDMVKVLWVDHDGMNLYVKCLEEGNFIWPIEDSPHPFATHPAA